MDGADSEGEVNLAALAERLRAKGLPKQSAIARLANVSQPTVSRAMRGLIATPSRAARKLWEYVNSRAAVLAVTEAAEVRRPRTGSSRLTKRRGKGPRKSRMLRLRLRAADDIAWIADLPRDQLAKIALDGLREYLDDAFDPLLVIEQLSVLRRAQDTRRAAPPKAR